MGNYTDDEIRSMKKITVKIAADYLGISPMMVSLGMRNNLLPIGFATKDEESYGDYGWTYAIVPERLIAYNHGKINEVQQTLTAIPPEIIAEYNEPKSDRKETIAIE